LSDRLNSGLEKLILERRELLDESTRRRRALSVKERATTLVLLAIEKELGDNPKAAG
jgi:hypothetical protein